MDPDQAGKDPGMAFSRQIRRLEVDNLPLKCTLIPRLILSNPTQKLQAASGPSLSNVPSACHAPLFKRCKPEEGIRSRLAQARTRAL